MTDASAEHQAVSDDLTDHVHEVQNWVNGGVLVSIRCADPSERAARLDELAAVLCSAAVAAAHAASAYREVT